MGCGKSASHPPKTYDVPPLPLKPVSNPPVTGNFNEVTPPPSPFPPRNAVPEHPFIPTREPYLFSTPGPHALPPPNWRPSPLVAKHPDVVDVDMNEVSPNVSQPQQQTQEASPSKPEKESRVVALGGNRRMFRSRHRKAAPKQRDTNAHDADEESISSEEEVIRPVGPLATNNHYTLNLASNTPTTKRDIPYALSGSAP